jgi:hypothetical protein
MHRHRQAILAALLALGCASGEPGPHSDPQGVQLSLFGDSRCSDPVFGQMAAQCCTGGDGEAGHDNCFAFGARWTPDGRKLSDRASFHLCNAEFLTCQLRWGVPPDIAEIRWRAVERLGWGSFHQSD